jgi:hypothetical protein
MSAMDEPVSGAALPSQRLWLELEPGEQLSGTLASESDGEPRRFEGWVELMALIDAERVKDHSAR